MSDSASSTPDVEARDVVKAFGPLRAVDGVSMDVPRGAFVTILGPSGCGKTTTLRLIGGFEHPDSGSIAIQGQSMHGRPPHTRPTSTVFQNYALFPHMTVHDNIAFGLRERNVSPPEIRRRVGEMLELVDLTGRGNHKPGQLSGGQQQRVALARSLVVKPAVLLLDEPLGALDLKLRRQMQRELKRIQRQVGITFLYVTHDQEEALTMSDHIVIMNQGRIEQEGTAEDVYERPATRFAASFMGAENILPATSVASDTHSVTLLVAGKQITIPRTTDLPLQDVSIVIRPERVWFDVQDGWGGHVVERHFKGPTISYVVGLDDGTRVVADVPADDQRACLNVGDTVRIGFRAEDATIVTDRIAPQVATGA